MSFQIHLIGPGLNLQARLKDTALDQVIRLVQENRDDQGGPPWPGMGPGRPPRPPHGPGPGPRHHGEGSPPPPSEGRAVKTPEARAATRKLADLSAPPLARHEGVTFAEKLLLLGAWTEARKEKFIVRGKLIQEAFTQAGETPPARSGRSISACCSGVSPRFSGN